MRPERLLASAVLGFVGLKCIVLGFNAVQFPVLRRQDQRPGGHHGHVSLLVPARDEESNLARALPTLSAQDAADEILVLDDESTDGTAEIVDRAARRDGRIRLIPGKPLPPGWTGKTWACHQLAEASNGDVLIFCDADVRLAPGALSAILDEADRQRSEVFSVFPRQQTDSLGERLLVPLIDDVLLCFLPHHLLEAPVAAAATANGQLLLFRREAYRLLGGHAAVRAAIVEDVRLALEARRSRLRLGLALGGDAVTVRMYEGYGAAVAGFGKSLRAAHGGSRALIVATTAGHLAAYTIPWIRATVRRPDRLTRGLWCAAAGLGILERILVNAVTGRRSYWEATLVPLTPVAALPLAARALRRTRVWKGRRYP